MVTGRLTRVGSILSIVCAFSAAATLRVWAQEPSAPVAPARETSTDVPASAANPGLPTGVTGEPEPPPAPPVAPPLPSAPAPVPGAQPANTEVRNRQVPPSLGPSTVPAPSSRSPLAPTVVSEGALLAGYHSGLFYIRDAADRFRIYPRARAQLDFYAPFGPGVNDLPTAFGEKPTAFIRRAHLELDGEVLGHWQWAVMADLGQAATDNSNGQGTTTVSSIDPATGAIGTPVVRSTPVQAVAQAARPTDVYMNYRVGRALNVQFGQFKVPVTLENRTNDFATNFMEAPLGVKNLVAYNMQRDIGLMVWGESHDTLINYSVGLFNGDGPNRFNVDANGDVMGRVFFHPFVAKADHALSSLQVGGSFRHGVRSARDVGYDLPAFSTQGRYVFWRPTYTDSAKNLIHVIPSGRQLTVAGELYWPVGRVDFTGEFLHIDWQTREARDLYQLTPFTERYGALTGNSYYITVAFWPLGDRKFVRRPGYSEPAHVDFSKPSSPTEPSLQLVARAEQMLVKYEGASRNGSIADPRTPNGNIKVTGAGAALNYYSTRHALVSVNYDLYYFPDSAPPGPTIPGGPAQTSAERALAPAQNLPIGVNNVARDHGHSLHELSVRLATYF